VQKQKEKGGKEQPPIIVKKIKKGHGGHHGGAWKVAYADFVTAMMALFLLLWILATSDPSQKAAIAQYFRDPGVFETSTGGGGNNPVAQFFGEAGILDAKRGILPETAIQGLKEQIEENLTQLQEYPEIKDQIMIRITAEGLLIELIDKDNQDKAFFDLSSAELKPALVHVLEKIVQQIREMPNKIAIGGHTDARPFRNKSFYSNWELSTARALNARRVMEGAGLPPEHIDRVVGHAASAPLVENDPLDPTNRRISLLILNSPALMPAGATTASSSPAEPPPPPPLEKSTLESVL